MSFVETRLVYVAAKLGIVDRIDADGSVASALAQELDVNEEALFRVMRSLASLGILRQEEDDKFFVTDLGNTLRSNSPGSVRDYALYSHEFLYNGYLDVMNVVRTGQPIIHDFFDHLQQNPDVAALFHAGQGSRGPIEIDGFVEAFDFGKYRKIVDVGGGNGALLSKILARNASVSGVLMDQEPAIAAAKAGRGGPLPRCDLVVGDFFVEVVEGGDLYILKRILTDWNDEKSLQILASCRRAMKDGVRLLIIEPIIANKNERSGAYLYDINYLVFSGGRVRTDEEMRRLLDRAGFLVEEVRLTHTDISILEAVAV